MRTDKQRSIVAGLLFLPVNRAYGTTADIFIAFTDFSFIASKMPAIRTGMSPSALVRIGALDWTENLRDLESEIP